MCTVAMHVDTQRKDYVINPSENVNTKPANITIQKLGIHLD